MIAVASSDPVAAAGLDDRALAERALRIGKRTALGVLRDPEAAADVAQEVAIAALRGAGAIRDARALDAWLHRVATWSALRHARREARRRDAERREPVDARRHAEADRPDAAADVLAVLPPRQRAALTLRYVHDLSDKDIARALGCRTSTVRTLLARGRDTLRATWPDHHEETDHDA